MSNRLDRNVYNAPMIGASSWVAATGTAVSGTYTFGSAGNGVQVRFVAPASATLTDFYFYVSAVGGTGGTTLVELRNYATTSTPGTTVHASVSVATGVAAKWYRATFATPYAVTRGTVYFLCMTANDATNFPTIVRTSGPAVRDANTQTVAFGVTTNGFLTGTASAIAPFVLAFGDGTTIGMPYAASSTTDTSNTRERGFKVLGLDVPHVLTGAIFVAAANANALKVYDATTAPGGTALQTQAITAGAAAVGAIQFDLYTLLANTVYRVVLGFSAASTAPGLAAIPDDTTYSAALDAVGFYGAQNVVHTIDNGAGGWTDSTDRVPRMALLVSQLNATAGGSRARAVNAA